MQERDDPSMTQPCNHCHQYQTPMRRLYPLPLKPVAGILRMGRCWLVGQIPKSLKGYVLSKRWSASPLNFTVMYLFLGIEGWPRWFRFPIAEPMTCALIQIGESSLLIIKQMPKGRGMENSWFFFSGNQLSWFLRRGTLLHFYNDVMVM